MKILYVEDSQPLRLSVCKALRHAGYAVEGCGDGEEGFDAASVEDFDLYVLDVMLPTMDGFEILRRLRADGDETRALMLTARKDIEDRVHGLDLGADDYLIKPFALDEFMARVHALLRRTGATLNDEVLLGPLQLNLKQRRAFCGKEEVPLRPREYAILAYLARRQGEVVTRVEIEDHVYDSSVELRSNAVNSAVCVLRRKLGAAGAEDVIRTVPGRGYLLAPV